jgi:ribosomal protein S18 acetylase RimI-like enzyme
MSDSALRRRTAVRRRPATPRDIALLRGFFADAHIELTVLPPDTRFVLVDMQFRAQRRQHTAQYPDAQHDILVADGVEVGRVLVDRSQGDCHIIDISVALGHRRAGIATTVLAEIIEAAVATGQRVWLTIWGGNAAARQLCERAGLAVSSDQDGYLTMERVVAPIG